ncbi:MAG: GntR family transcriptional regulator [Pigmentiphaga sp.]
MPRRGGIVAAMTTPASPKLSLRQPSNRMPLSLQIASLLRHRLQQGEWQVSDRMPTLDAFMVEYGVSRVTMRMAMTELEQEGLIERARGRGTVVIADVTQERWLMLPNQWPALVSHIEHLHARVVELESGSRQPSLEPDEGVPATRYWWARRINWTRQAPYSLLTLHLDLDIYERHRAVYQRAAILPTLAQHASDQIASADQVLTIASATVEVAQHLQLKVGAPTAEVRRIVRNHRREVIYLADVIYPAKHLRQETRLLPATTVADVA